MNIYHSRIAKCMELIQNSKLDKLIVTSKHNIQYLLGVGLETNERMTVLLLEPGNSVRVFVHQMFVNQVPLFDGGEIIYYTDHEVPIQILTPYLDEKDKVGIDQNWPSSYLIDMLNELGKVRVEKATIVEKLREIKDSEEIQTLRQSARIADAVMHQILQLQPFPTTEKEVSETIRSFFTANGASDLSFQPIICFGENSANPHHVVSDRGSSPNQPILIDMGGIYKGYCSDITRTFYHGKENTEFEDIYKIVKDAQIQAIEMIKPGVIFADIDRFIRKYFANWGLKDFFIHRTGHGIGLELHEAPFIHEKNNTILKEGMVFSIEPGIYLPDKFGVRIEDIVVVTEHGYEILNLHTKDSHYLDLQSV